jgi:RecA-family ATPase
MSKLINLYEEQPPKQYKTLRIQSLENIKPKPIEWLWPNMIAHNELHTMAGESGIGKTQLLLRTAATVSSGGTFPGEIEPCKQGKVIYLTGEDGRDHTIVPRLLACGADMAKILYMSHTKPDGSQWTLSQEELDELTEYVFDVGDVSLFIIDPITSFCGNKFDNDSVTDVRKLQTRLRNFIETTGVACIALTHLTKNSQNKAIHRILGSGAWTHGPRIVLGAIKDGDNYLFGKWSANITTAKGVYPYAMETHEVAYADGERSVVCIDWNTPELDKQLDEFETFQATANVKELTAMDEIEEELNNGHWHMKTNLIDRVKAKAQCSPKTVERAISQLVTQGLVEKELTSTTPPKAKIRWISI